MSKTGILFVLGLGLAGAACHHDQPAATGPGAATGSNGPSTMGGASMENSATGGPAGNAPGDSYNRAGVDPATGMTIDGGVGDAGMR